MQIQDIRLPCPVLQGHLQTWPSALGPVCGTSPCPTVCRSEVKGAQRDLPKVAGEQMKNRKGPGPQAKPEAAASSLTQSGGDL